MMASMIRMIGGVNSGTPMKFGIRRRLVPLVIALASIACVPMAANAQDNSNSPKDYDGRLDDFGSQVTLDSGGTALSYFLFGALAVIAIGGLFKSANRSHLD